MSKYRLSNYIFALGLNPAELSVYAYLCSIHTKIKTLDEANVIHVKQSTIALNCGIKAVQTVSKIIARLKEKGLIEPLERSTKTNHHKGTYSYAVKQLQTDTDYFYAERSVFGNLVPRQLTIYLFICKSFDYNLNICWNSFNDISEQTGMKRETVIQTINELVELKYIVRLKRKSKTNRKVYIDNHYQLILYVRGRIYKKKVRLHSHYNRTNIFPKKEYNTILNDSTLSMKSQVFWQSFFNLKQSRGSPQI